LNKFKEAFLRKIIKITVRRSKESRRATKSLDKEKHEYKN